MRRTNWVYGRTGLASLRLAWRGIYSEVTLTAYLLAALRLALVTRFFTFAPGIPVYPRSAFYRDSQNDGEFTAPLPPSPTDCFLHHCRHV